MILNTFDLSMCKSFQRKVLGVVSEIPPGRVMTYSGVAKAIDHPGASRAVGTALAKNPYPVEIPCHRVIRSDCTTGNYQGGPDKKRKLLVAEGVKFEGQGRVKHGHIIEPSNAI